MADLVTWIGGDPSCRHISRNVLSGGLQSCNHCGAVGLPKEAALYTQAVAAALDRALAAERERMVNAVWEEYQDSIVNKWTFRKEHVQNAIAKAAAIHAQGET